MNVADHLQLKLVSPHDQLAAAILATRSSTEAMLVVARWLRGGDSLSSQWAADRLEYHLADPAWRDDKLSE